MPCSLEIGKLTLPSISTDDPGKRCMDASHSGANNNAQLDQEFTVYSQSNGADYYTYDGRYLTPNNLHDPRVRAAFLRAATSIGQCTFNHALQPGNHEIVIILRCLSERRPKLSYYIVDHEARAIRWAHDRQFNDSPDLYDVNMRNVAEYWDYRSRFNAHRLCSQRDYDELLQLLDSLSTHRQDAALSRDTIRHHRERLTQQVQDPTTVNGTHVISDLHANVLKEQLGGFYEPHLPLRSQLMKSLHGLMRPPRFLHRRTHRAANPAPGVPAIGPMNPIREPRIPHPATHDNSPSSSRRTSPQSSTSSESSRRAGQAPV
ncbi:hypothetical protein FRC08_001360 [Ceratobasidium sp. 394]|nr:hypothetical protein FRC08_001360 [Ceratobasidium sp. 394]KAG9085477.1 hypothetical protein FS749_004387 [Ceratobasidium sp. UAMH 11750]